MSARAAAVRLMWCAKAVTVIDKSISRRENAARTDHLAREGKHSDQRQQLPLGAFLPRPPRGQAIAKPCKFVRREAHLLKRGVQGDAQELEAACQQDQLLRREGDTEVAAEVLESLQIAGVRSMGGPRQTIIIEVMEDAAAPANVYGNPVKRLRELSKKEGGRAGPKREPDVDVYSLFPRVAQERPIRGPHRAEAEGVADVRFRHKRVPPQAAHNGHGRIHGGIPYRNSSRGMPELTEAPLGEDKSKTRRTEPSDLSAAPRGEQWKSRNGGRTKRPAVCPRETSRATAAMTAERRDRADSMLRGRVGVTRSWYPNAKPDQR